jgi:hypothetical protein
MIRAAVLAAALAVAMPALSMNAINVIAPYKHHGLWVFDDARVGLDKEPFVAGADTMIDRAVARIADADRGFLLLFSRTPFPGHHITLEWRRNDGAGDWYFARELQQEGWLCPALLRYFEKAPERIYVQVKPKG